MRVDFKSVLLGIGLILVLFILMGQTNQSFETTERYQIIIAGERFGNPLFLLDTATGATRGLIVEPFFHWDAPIPTLAEALQDSTLKKIIERYYEEKFKGKK